MIGRRTPVGRDPQDVAVGFGSVWVANRGDGTVTRLSAATAQPEGAPIRVGRSPGALAVTTQGVLVLDTESGDVAMIDPRTERGDDALDQQADGLVVDADRRRLEGAVALDPDRTGAIHHHLGDVGIGE